MLLLRPLLFFVIISVGGIYIRHIVDTTERLDATTLQYIEDSKAGNGTRYGVLQRAEDTDGRSMQVEVLSRGACPGFYDSFSASTPSHVHKISDEKLHVLKGTLGFKMITPEGASRIASLSPGEELIIPKGSPHTLFNADNTSDVLYTLAHEPAGPLGERFFEDLAALGYEHGSVDRIHPLQVLVLFFEGDSIITDLPQMLQPVVRKVLLPVARLLGFKAHYPTHHSAGVSGKAGGEMSTEAEEDTSDAHAADDNAEDKATEEESAAEL